MKNNKTIENILRSWGENKREVPSNNDVLKNEILSKIAINPIKVNSTNHNRLPWLSFAFTAMALFALFINGTDYSNNSVVRTVSTQTDSPSQLNENLKSISKPSSVSGHDYYSVPIPRETNSPISDNREFLKIGYNATLKTMNVADLTTRTGTMVRGFGGRVDTLNSTERYGFVSFAIPKDELDAFRIEIKDLVGVRFYTEQINSQNLLSQKQNIEESNRQAEKSLDDLKAERGRIVRVHNQNIDSYQKSIDSMNAEINTLNLEYSSATVQRKTQIINRINQLQVEINIFKSKISSENYNYRSNLERIDSQIKYVQENIKVIQKQDADLLNNVATVNGSISLTQINLFEFVDAYVPGPLLTWIFIGAALVAYLWSRRSSRLELNSF